MSAPLPDALWARFQKLIEEGLSGRCRGKRDPHRSFFAEIIAQDRDSTMPELTRPIFKAKCSILPISMSKARAQM